jgi:hypothetical protein
MSVTSVSAQKRKGDAVQREIDVNARSAHIQALASRVELLRDKANAAEAAFQRGDVGAEIAMYKAKLELSEQCAALDKAQLTLDKAKLTLDKAKLEHRVALDTALADLAVLQQRVAAVTLNSAVVASSKSLSGQQKKLKLGPADAAPGAIPLMNVDIAATLDEFLAQASVAPLSLDGAVAVGGAMDTWWAHARDFCASRW